jgi:pteridine reductase
MTDPAQAGAPVALVTGAARRLGAAIARALHARGMRVAVHYRGSRTEAEALVAELDANRAHSAHAFRADLCAANEARALAEQVLAHFGALDVLVNNASSFYPTPVEEVSEAEFDDLIGSNLKGPVFLIAASAAMLRDRAGCVVNISDLHARRPLPAHPVYCAAKAALEGLTRALARDLAPQVRVNAVAPGAILWPEGAAASEAILAATALGRTGSPRDIADAVAYLALDAPFVTGQVLTVDGGRLGA